ncbi:S41 family peptidase [Dactylosporangium sp. NPDC051541]|uniref:S41 family peptidase n=1 Tax=Dactylosporangium sp. NPDC051541 TaxID=3363977 RepID=UPI0037A975E9
MSDTLLVRDLVGRLTGWLTRLMPPGARRDALVAVLTERFAAVDAPVTAAGCAAIERCAWTVSRHLALSFEPAGTARPDTVPPGWPDPDPEVVRARAACVSRVERLADGTCLISVDDLDAVSLAQPYLDAAFTLAQGSARILLDLRANGGGDPATVAHIAGRLLGDTPAQLSEVVYPDRRRQWWTPALPSGTSLRQPVAVLVGPGTFSSGEALAYHLQARGRVTVVGETTPGAADHITPIRLAPTVLAYLPEAYVVDTVTATNWEGTGVVPDIASAPDTVIETAVAALR